MDCSPDLRSLLRLERIDENLYRSVTVDPVHHLYGGQVAAQALVAACATVPPDRLPHSVHGYFLRPGDPEQRVLLRVDRDRDGRSYTSRRVTAVQDGAVIFNMAASFHRPEEGDRLQMGTMPAVPFPEELPSRVEPAALLRSFDCRIPPPFEVHRDTFDRPTQGWFRVTQELPPAAEDPSLHLAALLYLSDTFTGVWTLPLETSREPHTSIDHAMWFHVPVDLSHWVFLDTVGVAAAVGRAFYTGSVFDREGNLLATLAQESLCRVPRSGVAGGR